MKKVFLVNIHDYPRKEYLAYWEIRVNRDTFEWGVRVYHYDTNKLLEEKLGGAESRDEADTLAQTWVKEAIEKYRRK
jgi:hypothetical protein